MEETFTREQVIDAVKNFLEYGEHSFNPHKSVGERAGHSGYFSGGGWAARALRWHLTQLIAQTDTPAQHTPPAA